MQKREQSLQEVPLAVSAFTGDFLDNGQIFSTDDLSQILPTVSILGAATPNNKVLRVRGIGTQSFGAAVEPSVSMVIDGYYENAFDGSETNAQEHWGLRCIRADRLRPGVGKVDVDHRVPGVGNRIQSRRRYQTVPDQYALAVFRDKF